MSVYLSKLTYCICLGALERALEKFDRFKDERYDLIAENQIWFEKCIALETKVDTLNDSIVALNDTFEYRYRKIEDRVEYWRKMYCALCRTHKRLVRKHSRCPKKTMFLYR